MFYVLIGVVFWIIYSVLLFVDTKKIFCSVIGGFLMIFTIMLCVSSIIIQAFHPGIEPKSFEDTYQLESIGLNYYIDDKKNNISVIAIIEENPTNLTFSKNIVTFKTNSKIPNIYIEGIRYTEPNEQQDFWFWTGDYRRNKNNEFEDKYKKVVISLPKEFTQKNNQSVEVSSSTQKHETILEESNDGTISSQTKRNKKFCNMCGWKLEDSSKFCSQCGKQL